MARVIIGAGAGYFLNLFFVALVADSVWQLRNVIFFDESAFTLTCVLVGAVMGWAWDNIVSGDGPKDD